MKLCTAVLVALACQVSVSLAADDNYTVSTRRFPEDFMFGTASAAYQIEGGWDADGKGESVWDRSTHEHPEAFSNSNGDIACDSYNKYKEDVQLLSGLGVNTYRFSIAWARVLPTGFIDQINEAGLQYYRNLIAELKAANITPLVTMHHWDLPQNLEDLGGFPNASVVDAFVDYARLLFTEFGDDVKWWITFNEPKQTCEHGYGTGVLAPMVKSPGIKDYQCAHNLLLAHAKAYHMYDEEFREKQNGKVSMVIDSNWFEPASDSAEDIEAANRTLLFTYGWFAHPIIYGNYPEVMIERIRNRSLEQGFTESRLPVFSEEEQASLKGTADYMTVNIYTSSMVSAQDEPDYQTRDRDSDIGTYVFQPSDWEPTVTDWFKVVPWGSRKLLKWISDTYQQMDIIVTENGYHDNGTVLHDMDTRGRYHKLYMSNIQDALYEDGVNVKGYMAWALTDDFEWQYGYRIQLGLYHIDFDSANRTRTAKDSASYYRQVVTTRCLVDECTD